MHRRIELFCLHLWLLSATAGCVRFSEGAAFACEVDGDCPQGSCVDGLCAQVAPPPGCTKTSCEGVCGTIDDGCGAKQNCYCPGGPADCTLAPGTEAGVCCHAEACNGRCNTVPDGCGREQQCGCDPGLVCSDPDPVPGSCCEPLQLSCDIAPDCAVLADECMGLEVLCGCHAPDHRCSGSPARCEPCNCGAGEACLLDGSCVLTAAPRCYGALKEVRELDNFEENAGHVRNASTPSLSFASRDGATWLYFLTGRWQTADFYWTDFAEVRLTSALSADAGTLEPIPFDSGGFKYHVSAAPDGSELFLSSGSPGPEGWTSVGVYHAVPEPAGGWSVSARLADFGSRDSDPVTATLLPDLRTVIYVDHRNPFVAKTAQRATPAPDDVDFGPPQDVSLDPSPRFWPNAPSCDGSGLFYVADRSTEAGVELEPRFAPILSYAPLTFGVTQPLSVAGLPLVQANIALAETPDCRALWLWIDGHLYATPRIPCP